MSSSSCVDLRQTPAVVEWQWDNATCSLATPDPSNTSIQLTIRLDSTRLRTMYALFEILIPIKLKDISGGCGIYLRICPSSVTSFGFSSSATTSEAVKQKFNSATVCLDFHLDKTPTVLVPATVREPVVAARARSGRILDAVYQLSRTTAFSVYIKDALLSNDHLHSISNGVKQGHLKPFPGPDHDISRMYGGKGAKIANLPDPTPPSYAEAASLPPPNAPAYERKRPRPNSQESSDTISQIWAELQMINKRDALHTATLEAIQHENQELKADNAKLRAELETLKKSHKDLEEEVAELRRVNVNMDLVDIKDAEKIEMQDDIIELANRVDYLDRGKDDDAFLQRVRRELLHEIATRLSGD